MAKNVDDILRENNIELGARGFSGDKASTLCPQCSPFRKKRSSRCLQIYLHPTGVTFKCYHCSFKGGGFFDENPKRRQDRESKGKSLARPARPIRSYYR